MPDRLFRNEGDGRFTDVSETAGITRADGAGLGVSTGDYNGDGWLDLYVANDATPNQLWINQKDGTFVDEGPLAGVALNAAGNPEGSMGVASGDYDRDGDEDLFITNIIAETFALYTNDGRAGFDDTRVPAGLAQPTAAFTGFGTDWIDYDNDGWLDLFVANGAVNIVEALRGQPVPYRMRNQLFRNLGTGTFVGDVDARAAPRSRAPRSAAPRRSATSTTTATPTSSSPTTTAPSGCLRNRVGNRARHGCRCDWTTASPIAQGLGALVHVERAGAPPQVRRVRTDGSYLTAQDPTLHVWPGGVERPGDRARRLARRNVRAVRGRKSRPARDPHARDGNRSGAIAGPADQVWIRFGQVGRVTRLIGLPQRST